jgi:methionyl-tRNA formyltransferase
MRVVLMGRKPLGSECLKYLIQKGIQVTVVVAEAKDEIVHWSPRLLDTAISYGIPTATDEELYESLRKTPKGEGYLENIDLVISLTFRNRIRKPLIDLAKIGCINFHPGPLPAYRGYVSYNFGIYENIDYWEVTAHFVEETFDSGDIIKTKKFSIDPETETAFSLEQKSQPYMLDLFKDVIGMAQENGALPRTPQGKGRYFSKKEFEKLREIHSENTLEEIERKIRAFWYPPYGGAFIKIQGKEFTVVNKALLKDISRRYHG